MSQRELAVAGQFYPDTKEELLRYIEHFNNIKETNNIKTQAPFTPRAIIVPHAGYVYSGFTANLAYHHIPKDMKNIIVIGPSHKFAFKGASVSLYNIYPTPLGDISINQTLGKSLLEKFAFLNFYTQVHCEHSTETQAPFIKHYTKDKNILEIIYSDCDYKDISKLIEELLKDKDNFIVISTDLSHFYDIKKANSLDSICLEAIEKKDIDTFEKGCEACGQIGVKAILSQAIKQNFKTKILDYRTSADISKDSSNVVGYTSAIIG